MKQIKNMIGLNGGQHAKKVFDNDEYQNKGIKNVQIGE